MFDEKKIYRNPNAALSENSRGRKQQIPQDSTYRTEYQRDIHRILYSQPFRRLRHKTQVFFLPHNDHICTRIEHSIHVASASRVVARILGLNEDLAEAIGLAHDIGHTPFGHHGEHVLNELAQEHEVGICFEHEIHGLRVVDKLAGLDRYHVSGLNLTYEVRDGIISHCGERHDRILTPVKEYKDLESIQSKNDVKAPCTFEGCIVRMVDRITYAGRDVEDALVAGLIREEDIPPNIVTVLGGNNGKIVGVLLEDLIGYSKLNKTIIGISDEKFKALTELVNFNYENIYKNEQVERFKKQATYSIKILFKKILKDLEDTNRLTENMPLLPKVSIYDDLKRFIKAVNYTDKESDELIVLDFIAGMTDNYVVRCFNEIFVPKAIT